MADSACRGGLEIDVRILMLTYCLPIDRESFPVLEPRLVQSALVI